MKFMARIKRIADQVFEVSYNFERDVGVFVGSVPISGEHRFASKGRALAWIKETASAFGVDKENVWIEMSCGRAFR
jgi:hypothetical protein